MNTNLCKTCSQPLDSTAHYCAEPILVTMTDIQRMKCMCGETRCTRCGHPMTAFHEVKEPNGSIKRCPRCGVPFKSKLLNP